jgi:hypothetical protein
MQATMSTKASQVYENTFVNSLTHSVERERERERESEISVFSTLSFLGSPAHSNACNWQIEEHNEA